MLSSLCFVSVSVLAITGACDPVRVTCGKVCAEMTRHFVSFLLAPRRQWLWDWRCESSLAKQMCRSELYR